MSSFKCRHCNTMLIDTPDGYITHCEHFPGEAPVKSKPTKVAKPCQHCQYCRASETAHRAGFGCRKFTPRKPNAK